MDNSIASILISSTVSFVVGAATSAISFAAYSISKRKVYADVIAASRIKWVADVRQEITDFIAIYHEEKGKPPNERDKLMAKAFEIELFLNYSYDYKAYTDLRDCLSEYLSQPEDEEITNHESLIEKSQKVLADAFNRAKTEAGITERMDDKARKSLLER